MRLCRVESGDEAASIIASVRFGHSSRLRSGGPTRWQRLQVEIKDVFIIRARETGDRPEVIIYTDGACSGNPGPGGWAAVLRYGDHIKEIAGGEEQTTNQRMELQAAIEALSALKRPCRVRLYSDSAYLINAFRERWFDRWLQNGWRNAKGDPVENRELWERLLALARVHTVEWIKVQGHAGDEWNERCDKLAKEQIERLKQPEE